MQRTLALAALALISATPARADLRYAAHLESAAPAVSPATKDTPKSLAPYDKADVVVTMSTDAARLVYAKAVLFVPEGAAMIRHLTDAFVVNSRDRTFSIVDTRGASGASGHAVTFTRTGEMEEIAGVQAEHVIVRLVRPDALRIEGDIWLADQFAAYQTMEAVADPVTATLSKEAGWPGGFVLRADLTGSAFGQRHIIKTITSIGEVPPQPDAYAIPSGYRQIPITSQVPQAPAISRPGVHAVGEPGVVAPKPTKIPKPSYTPEAMARRLQGVVRVSAIVETDGRIKEAKVVRSIDKQYGLDESAISNARDWRFTPGTFNGTPAPIVVSIDIEFSIRDR